MFQTKITTRVSYKLVQECSKSTVFTFSYLKDENANDVGQRVVLFLLQPWHIRSGPLRADRSWLWQHSVQHTVSTSSTGIKENDAGWREAQQCRLCGRSRCATTHVILIYCVDIKNIHIQLPTLEQVFMQKFCDIATKCRYTITVFI